MEAAFFPGLHPLPTSELPARVSQAAAPSLGWHRISICLVKLKVCTAPKSESGRAEGPQEAEIWEHQPWVLCQQDHADTPLLFTLPAPSKGPILPLGQAEWS